MAVKARAEITLTSIRDVQSVTRYYLLQSSTSAAPAKPTTNPPGGSWATSEPTYTSGSTNSLYFTDCTVFSDGTFVYSDVSLSSSYEAAKVAYNKAAGAEDVATAAQETANGKNTVYYQASAPSGGTYKVNDIWFETDNGNKMYMWNGNAWTAETFGTAAISNLAITNAKIANGTIENAKIANLDAGKVTSGTMSAARIKGDELKLGGDNNTDGVMKVYNANGELVGSFTKEGLMAIAGTIAGWTINPGEFYTEWNQSTSNYKARLSTRDGLKFEKTNSETGFEQFLRQVIFGADNTVFLYRDRDGFQTAGFIRGIEGTAPGSSVDGGISISPNLLVTDGDGAIYADQLRISTIENGSYVRQPQMIMAGKTSISGGTSQKRATICSIPTAYRSGWRIVPFVTRAYGNSGVAPADNGDFYYAYYNSADHEVDIKLANLLPSGVVFTFDYMIYAVPETT